MPDRIFIVVDLPAPLGPIKPSSSPRSSEKLMLFERLDSSAPPAHESFDRAPRAGLAFGDEIRLRQILNKNLRHAQSLQGKPSIVYDARPPINERVEYRNAALGHGIEPKLTNNPVITVIAKRVNKTPAQVLLAWAIQRGTAPLTTATTARYVEENFDISTLPDDAIKEISEGISTRIRLNPVVNTGIPGFIPRAS